MNRPNKPFQRLANPIGEEERHPELPRELPEFNPSAYIQRNIAEFKGLFEREVYDENYGAKTREEKEELIALVKGFRFYYMEDIGRFMLKIFDNKISHITLTDQLAYRTWL
uniref:DUF3408 domain-containing protein n=1 Tax=Globodera pallida TaxID=36090 RepID=A0A183BMB1_GLOPA